ncbi:MAG: type IV pilin protein [Thiobacillus sp.]
MNTHRQSGFTLIELMIVVAIIGILASIVYPSYTDYLRSSRRADAQSDMLKIQMGMEKWRANNNTYSSNLADAGFTDTNPYYAYTITGATASAYTINAAAGGDQLNDTGCTALTLDQSGGKGAASACWKK